MTNVSVNKLGKYNKHNKEICLENKTSKSKLNKISKLFNSRKKRKVNSFWKKKYYNIELYFFSSIFTYNRRIIYLGIIV